MYIIVILFIVALAFEMNCARSSETRSYRRKGLAHLCETEGHVICPEKVGTLKNAKNPFEL